VYRAHPQMVTIEQEPVLDERNIEEAEIMDEMGGYALRIKFDLRGSWLLEEISTANRGHHYVVFCSFGKETKTSRWLAAPLFTNPITDGTLVFTPDASREETEEIAEGLTHVVKQAKSKELLP